MILYELVEDEQHPAYRVLSSDNLDRQYGFLTSNRQCGRLCRQTDDLTAIIQALNYHAICCLHVTLVSTALVRSWWATSVRLRTIVSRS